MLISGGGAFPCKEISKCKGLECLRNHGDRTADEELEEE